jgi:hypothetical protein
MPGNLHKQQTNALLFANQGTYQIDRQWCIYRIYQLIVKNHRWREHRNYLPIFLKKNYRDRKPNVYYKLW